jgi:hypothetical protein
VPKDEEQKLKFWVEVEESLQNSYFNVDASAFYAGRTYKIGSAYVAVCDITLETPQEVGTDGTDSELFTVKGEASAIAGYKIRLNAIRLEDGEHVMTTELPAPLNTSWYNKNIQIPDAGKYPGAYLIIANLVDDKGNVVADDDEVVNVVADPLRLVDIYLKTGNTQTFAKKPVTNYSYVSGSVSVSSSYYTLSDINIATTWEDSSVVSSAAFIVSTNLETKSVDASISDGVYCDDIYHDGGTIDHRRMDGIFWKGSVRGYGAGKIYLAITKTDGTVVKFLVAKLSLLVDPSGYVYNKVTNERIENATTTLEEFVGNKWQVWDGMDSGQSNPQRTDEEGKYRWDVMPGTYRVLVTAAGFHAYNTLFSEYGEIEVLPPREDINIGMLPDSVTLADSISITGAGGSSRISAVGGTLQLSATVNPVGAYDMTVRWSVVTGSAATVNASGLVTATSTGSVTVRATANDGSGKYGDIVITVGGQNPPSGGSLSTGSSSTGGGGGGSTTAATIPAVTLPAVAIPEMSLNPFTDVSDADWFYGDVNYAYANGLFTGTSSTTFSPSTSMTRGMLVTVLGRLHGINAAEFTGNSFVDVNVAEYYAPYIEWAKTNGIVQGVGWDYFAPDAIITRQDLAVIIVRYIDYAKLVFPVTEKFALFADGGDIADYANNAVQTLVNAGILNGKLGNMFDPRGYATRAEVAAVLHRFADTVANVSVAAADVK